MKMFTPDQTRELKVKAEIEKILNFSSVLFRNLYFEFIF